MQQKEDSLKNFAVQILEGRDASDRFRADSQFTRMLVRALKIPYSFSYPFDSLETISRIYSPDTSFRIITWQVVKDENTFRRHGAIQMRTSDGSLKLFPLLDNTRFSENWMDTITNNEAWVGAIYYNVVLKKLGNKKYYTLFGYDEHNMRSTRKIIAVDCAVPSALSIRPRMRMPPLATAITPHAAAPIAAASVGLAQPP